MLFHHLVDKGFNPHPKLLSILTHVSCVDGHLRILPNHKIEEKVLVERLPRKLIAAQKFFHERKGLRRNVKNHKTVTLIG